MNIASLVRHAWMDLLSAAAFLAVFLFRDRFAPETLSTLLLWPVLFEVLLAFGLVLASMGDAIGRAWARNLWFASIAIAYTGLAALGSARTGAPWLWVAALWLLFARVRPPGGCTWLGPDHRRWLFTDGLRYSSAICCVALLIYLFLIAAVPGDCSVDAGGERSCKSQAWVFIAVWVPYFVVEALVRASRLAALPVAAKGQH
jgi:hypothetical protein